MRLVLGSEVLEISHEGTMVRVAGTLRRYSSADLARTAYEKAVAAKQAEGFVVAPDVVSDLEARLVYADELQVKGDPIGELIAVQHMLANIPPAMPAAQLRKVERRFAALLEQHHDALFGPLAAFVRRPSRTTPARPALEITWRLGFADEMRIQRVAKIELHELYAELRRLPIARFMTKLVVGDSRLPVPPGHWNGRATYSPLLNTMAKDGAPAHMRSVVLGDVSPDEQRVLEIGDLRPVLETCNIEELEIKAGSIIAPLSSQRLQRLLLEDVLEGGLREIARSKLPALTELAVLNAHAHDLLHKIVESPILSQLRALTLRRSYLEDPDLELITELADRFEHLERFDVRGNDFSRASVRAARLRLPRLKA